MFNTNSQIYPKIEVFLKNKPKKEWQDGLKSSMPQKTRYVFENARLHITGNSLIVIDDKIDENADIISSTGKIFNLNDVVLYNTYNINNNNQ